MEEKHFKNETAYLADYSTKEPNVNQNAKSISI